MLDGNNYSQSIILSQEILNNNTEKEVAQVPVAISEQLMQIDQGDLLNECDALGQSERKFDQTSVKTSVDESSCESAKEFERNFTFKPIYDFEKQEEQKSVYDVVQEHVEKTMQESTQESAQTFVPESYSEQEIMSKATQEVVEEAKKTFVQEAAQIEAIDQIHSRLDGIESAQRHIFSETRDLHKLYHAEFAGRLRSMQNELDYYRNVDKGRAYDEILAALARIYSNNETLSDEIKDLKVKKSIRYLLLDIEELLESYGMHRLRSVSGEKRNPRHCKIIQRIETDDPNKHDTVAKSYYSGFFIENRTIIKEAVDIYYYEVKTADVAFTQTSPTQTHVLQEESDGESAALDEN